MIREEAFDSAPIINVASGKHVCGSSQSVADAVERSTAARNAKRLLGSIIVIGALRPRHREYRLLLNARSPHHALPVPRFIALHGVF